MALARLVVTAVRVEGRPISAVAREYGVSRRWVHELLARYDPQGGAGLHPRPRRPHTSPHATPPAVEDHIVAVRNSSPTTAWTPAPTPSPTTSPSRGCPPHHPPRSGAS
jgi:transposase